MKKIQVTQYSQDKLKVISMKEIMNEYPDKVVDVINRKNDAVLVLDTCRIVFKKTKKEELK
jgi:hypothetical protein